MKFSIEFFRRSLRLHILTVIMIGLSSLLNAGEWQQESPLNTPRYGATAVVLDGYIYVMGGVDQAGMILNTVERYDTSDGSWSLTAVPHFDDPRLDAAAIIFDGKIYLSGGLDHDGQITDEVEIYDPVLNEWSEGEKLRRPRRGHVILPVNQSLCAMGGIRDLNNTYEPEIEYLEDDDWREAPSDLPNPVASPFAAGIGNMVYLFGGIFNTPVSQSSAASVDGSWSFSWSTLPTLGEARGSGATVVRSDSIFLFGGITVNGTTDRTEVFAITSGQLISGPTLSSPRASLAAVDLDNTIYLIGGYGTSPSQPLGLVESYRTVTAIDLPPQEVPSDFVVIRGYPNPFNGVVNIVTASSRAGQGSLIIYDISGREIVELARGFFPAGEKTHRWNGRNRTGDPATSGIYFAMFRQGDRSQVIKLVFSR